MARISITSGTALGRKLYRESTSICIAPVSKGTWTVTGQTGQGRDRRTVKYTGVTDLTEIPELVELGLEELLDA